MPERVMKERFFLAQTKKKNKTNKQTNKQKPMKHTHIYTQFLTLELVSSTLNLLNQNEHVKIENSPQHRFGDSKCH